MARPDKAAAVAEMTDQFRSSNAAVLTEYRGLTVAQLQDLRRALGDDVTYAVVKNTLTKIAAKQAGVESFDALLQGPSAIAFIQGDPVEAAKALRDFARANSPLVIKGGVLDGNPITPAEIAKIADLESREVLLGQLAGALLASLQNAAYLFNAPLSQAARLAGALQAKAEEDPSILKGGAGETAPSDDATAAGDTAAADDTTASDDTAAATPAADAPEADAAEADAPAEPVEATDAAVPPAGVVVDDSADTSEDTTEG